MTRFARAKGSKSSNEKVPEEATPWSQLKKGILMKREPLTEETKKCVSALKSQVEDKKSAEWVDFDDENDSLNILKNHLEKKKTAKCNLDCDDDIERIKKNVEDRKRKNVENVQSKVQKKKQKGEADCQDGSKAVQTLGKEEKSKKKMKQNVPEDGRNDSEVLRKRKNINVNVAEGGIKDRKKKKKTYAICESSNSEETNEEVKETNEITEKMHKKKKKLTKKEVDSFEEDEKKTKKLSKNKKMKTFAGDKSLKNKSKIGNETQSKNTKKMKMTKKNRNKSNDDKLTINIGGEMVKIVKFQGFYVTEKDSERLKELRKKMIQEKIPQSQIEGAIKLERRRCEKALSRMKKNVCFQCRKPGHVLTNCPEIQQSVDTTTGVCYKCGSTEHKAFSCKVNKGQKFPFAECFICKEKGHIARECPDNPRGLYPKGGSCKICGDVTHLKKDCPKRISETEERTIKLGVVDDRNLEGLDDGNEKIVLGDEKKHKKRPVRF